MRWDCRVSLSYHRTRYLREESMGCKQDMALEETVLRTTLTPSPILIQQRLIGDKVVGSQATSCALAGCSILVNGAAKAYLFTPAP